MLLVIIGRVRAQIVKFEPSVLGNEFKALGHQGHFVTALARLREYLPGFRYEEICTSQRSWGFDGEHRQDCGEDIDMRHRVQDLFALR